MKLKVRFLLLLLVPFFMSCGISNRSYIHGYKVIKEKSEKDNSDYSASKRRKINEKESYSFLDSETEEENRFFSENVQRDLSEDFESKNTVSNHELAYVDIANDGGWDDGNASAESESASRQIEGKDPTESKPSKSIKVPKEKKADNPDKAPLSKASFIISVIGTVLFAGFFMGSILLGGWVAGLFGAFAIVVGLIFSITSIVLGIFGLKEKSRKSWMALAGLIIGGILSGFIIILLLLTTFE